MFNNYQGTQTICSTFNETPITSPGAPISTSSTLTTTAFDGQASLDSTSGTRAAKSTVGDKFASLFDDEDEDDSVMNNQERFRRELHKKLCIYRLNQLALGLVLKNLSEALDLLSYCLLNKNMSPNEKNALKLSASQTTTEELPLRLKITEKKLQLIEGVRHKSEEMQALDVIEYLVLMLRRKEQRHSSELAFYRVTAHIMDIILQNHPFINTHMLVATNPIAPA